MAAACFAVGWAIITGWPVAQSGSQAIEPPVSKPALEQELPADGLLDNLQPVQEWFEENVPQGRQAVQPYQEYMRVSDDSDTISFQARREWNDIDIVQWKENGHEQQRRVPILIGCRLDDPRNGGKQPRCIKSINVELSLGGHIPASLVPSTGQGHWLPPLLLPRWRSHAVVAGGKGLGKIHGRLQHGANGTPLFRLDAAAVIFLLMV